MVTVTEYDEVRDGQRHFRSLLDSLSRPGPINALDGVDFTSSPRLNKGSALVAFALLNADASFYLVNMTPEDVAFLAGNTRANAVPIEQASFIFCDGQQHPDVLEDAPCGSLAYPDAGATIVVQVDALSEDPLPGGLKLTLRGPGVDGSAAVFVRSLNPDLLLALQAGNAEFPLGIDAIVTCDGGERGEPRVLGIPRTAKLSWEPC